MLFKKRTLYTFGFIAGICTTVGAVLLIASTYLGILFTLASVLGAAMMFFMAPSYTAPLHKALSLFAAICLIFAMLGGSVQTLQGMLTNVAGAISWPIFAFIHRQNGKSADDNQQNITNTIVNLVIIAGVAQLVFSFIPLDEVYRVVLAAAIGAVQTVFAYVQKSA